MPLEITRRLEFDAGHRILGHESKCKHLHGHRYVAEITVSAPSLDELGRVVDFSILKSVVGRWVDECLDHNMILHPNDPLALLIEQTNDVESEQPLTGGKPPFIMPSGKYANPTAENLSHVILAVAAYLLTKHTREHGLAALSVTRVRLYETPNCWADAVWTYEGFPFTVSALAHPNGKKDPQ